MKPTPFLSAILSLILISTQSNAQLLKRIQKEVKCRTENIVVREAGNTPEKSTDKAKEGNSDTVKGLDGKETRKKTEMNEGGSVQSQPKQVNADYRSYDFVAGDKIIFQPDLSAEADAETPARSVSRKAMQKYKAMKERKYSIYMQAAKPL